MAKYDCFFSPGRGNMLQDWIKTHKLKIVVIANGKCFKDKELVGRVSHHILPTSTRLAKGWHWEAVQELPGLSG